MWIQKHFIKVHGSETIIPRVRSKPYRWPFIMLDSWSPYQDCILGMDFSVQIGARIVIINQNIVQGTFSDYEPENV